MATFTAIDIQNATKFAKTNVEINRINLAQKKAPHLASWLEYKIRDATPEDYFIPPMLKASAKVVDVIVTEHLCNKLSCNVIKEKSTCQPDEPPSYYRLGDADFGIQCQPACYNVSTIKAPVYTNNTSTTRASDNLPMKWVDNNCRLIDPNITSWMEKPYYRSDTHYERRVNDMPTGMTRVEAPGTMFGISYTINKTYCEYYDLVYDTETRNCDFRWWEKGLNFVVGMSLINTVKSGIRTLINTEAYALPDLKPIPPIEPKYLLDAWQKDINTEFVLPTTIDTRPQLKRLKETLTSEIQSAKKRRVVRSVSTTDSDNEDNVIDSDTDHEDEHVSEFLKYRAMGITQIEYEKQQKLREYVKHEGGRVFSKLDRTTTMTERNQMLDEFETNILHAVDDYNQPTTSARSARKKRAIDTPTQNELEGIATIDAQRTSKIYHIISGLIHGILSKEFAEQILVDRLIMKILFQVRTLSLKIIETLITETFTTSGILIGSKISMRVFSTAFGNVMGGMVGQLLLQTTSRTLIAVAKITANLATIVGIVTAVLGICDLIFAIWDPYGYSARLQQEAIDSIMQSAEMKFRGLLTNSGLNYKVETLYHQIFTEEDWLKIQVDSILDTVTYLDALTVNSDGQRIDKTEVFDFTEHVNKSYTSELSLAVATQHIAMDTEHYNIYNNKMMDRVDLVKKMNIVGLLLLGGGLVMFGLKLILFAVLLVVLAVFVFFVARLNVITTMLVEPLSNLKSNIL